MEVVEKIDLKRVLKQYFGFDEFRGKQEDVMSHLLAGNDCFVIMPTGAGKSLCYQLPAIAMEGTALVISPLIALMKNQVDQLRAFGIEAGFLNSSMNRGDYEEVKRKVIAREIKLLYVAPESLVKEEFIDFLKKATISFVAVDEAHCISEWGHDFRPEYRRIREILNHIKSVPIIALTATATPKVQLDIQLNLKMQQARLFITSFNRDNLYYEVRPKVDSITEIIKFIKKKSGKSGIIYCLSRRKVEELAAVLKVNGIKAVPYHAGLDSKLRTRHQDMFLNEDVHVVVATIAFGMGIDKPDVRFVIHYDVPKSIESYYQETGRAGRDGLEGSCVLFYDFNDIVKLEKFMKDKPVNERESGRLLLFEMAAFCESGMCRRKFMLHYFGESYDDSRCNGMCDNCRYPKERYDGTKHAKQGLATAKQVKGKFSIDHMVKVLVGATSQQVMLNEHHNLPIHGRGSDMGEKEWKSVFAQLIVHDFLRKDIDDYGVIKLSKKGEAFLKDPHPVELLKYRDYAELERKKEKENSEQFSTYDEVLFDLLKKLRKVLATEKEVPPYVVFQDPSLEDMASKFPISMDEFLNIVGVGKGKAQKFAVPFIALISKYVEENNIEHTEAVVVKKTGKRSMNKLFFIQHVDRKTPLNEIARLKNISFGELLTDLEHIIYSGTKLNLNYYISREMDPDTVDDIYDYFMSAETDSLDVAEDELGGAYTREEIQLVRAKFIAEV
ncbi:MAG TPA: DNA helicase RecQ, partial [Bacteroidetes bacterium]|nr:DNA helicase RecQ [Bacteroidota bacterium]